MKTKTQYVPCSGALCGPEFDTMTEANLWIIKRNDGKEWTVKLQRTPLVPAEASHYSTHQHLEGPNT